MSARPSSSYSILFLTIRTMLSNSIWFVNLGSDKHSNVIRIITHNSSLYSQRTTRALVYIPKSEPPPQHPVSEVIIHHPHQVSRQVEVCSSATIMSSASMSQSSTRFYLQRHHQHNSLGKWLLSSALQAASRTSQIASTDYLMTWSRMLITEISRSSDRYIQSWPN